MYSVEFLLLAKVLNASHPTILDDPEYGRVDRICTFVAGREGGGV